ncbi:putative transport protein [Glonium stellatum]|uniref:Putative transport protein n=1 Tax=Glonium stellatum TaxID=574774 RepID=A0A8E2EXD6_9PEZI|nr:putative transport protein [Glonium stellatum]
MYYISGLLPDPDIPYTPTNAHCHMWLVSLGFEIAWLTLAFATVPVKAFVENYMDAVQITLSVSRCAILACMVSIYWWSAIPKEKIDDSDEEERQGLLSSNNNSSNSTEYGTPHAKLKGVAHPRTGDAQTTTYLDYIIGFSKLFPFLWPSESRSLQIRTIFCFSLLLVQRAVNIFVPHQLGVVVAALGPGKIPYMEIMFYIIFRALQGQQGVVGSIRALLWIPISQSTYRRLTSAAFHHVLLLSLDFHLNKRIGEVMSALSKGSALNTFLDGLVFQLMPMVADLWIAAVYFFIKFNALYALMVVASTWMYLFVTIYMAKYRGRARREMVMREREMEAAKTDALLSYETVHHSGAIPMEISRFERLISVFQTAEYRVFFSLNLLNAMQNGVFTFGVMLICYLNAYEISVNLQQVSMFVTLLTYLAQLQAPLNFFGSFYTQVQNNLVDAERMLDLFKEQPTIQDRENALDLESCRGKISFCGVAFAYKGKSQALKDISFQLDPGTSAAIVGESGSGKSTILKLLFRFYDVDHGSIKIDDTDIRDVTLDSFRSHISVVPQDTILFNDTLMHNLMYASPNATELEVFEACRAASIHDKILHFPQGYETNVGERGLKLSGGERQRIAIARTFLRSPRILLLDEATASLDSETEKQIQTSLEKASEGRTTITIAHRLSTITKADQIIVLHQGRIAEKGRHAELLAKGGRYAQMWNKQTKEEKSPQ